MRKIGLALVGGEVIIPAPAVAQSSEIECAKMSGGIQIIVSDPRQFRWYFPSDMLAARYNDCVAPGRLSHLSRFPRRHRNVHDESVSEKSTRHRAKSPRQELVTNNRRVPDKR